VVGEAVILNGPSKVQLFNQSKIYQNEWYKALNRPQRSIRATCMPQKGWFMKRAFGIIEAPSISFQTVNKLEGFIFPGE